MPIQTNLSVSPFFDDFDPKKKFYRELFKPGYALQARELNQLQSILQNQIEQFGDNIYQVGTIIKGCNFTALPDLHYVKVVDDVTPSDYLERTVANADTGVVKEYYYELEGESTGLKAIVITAADGFISRSPDLNTFFVRYLNSGDAGQQAFISNETLNIREYYIQTDEDGDQTVVDNGIVDSTTVSGLVAPVGNSFGLTVSEGVIFQKGAFLYVDQQTVIVVKYKIDVDGEPLQPDALSVGFVVDENIVTSKTDETLLDNSNGSPNEQAPGADRLQLVPRLVAVSTATADADDTFFTLIRYENGNAVVIRDVTEFNSIAREMAERTAETSGDYITDPFELSVERRDGDVVITAGAGTVYVNGYRVQTRAEQSFEIDEPDANTDVVAMDDQPVPFVNGQYVAVTSAAGNINTTGWQTCSLIAANSTVIGTAIVREYTGSKLYLHTVRMANTSTKFSQVATVRDGVSDGLVSIVPALKDSKLEKLIFDIGAHSVVSVSDMRFPVRSRQTNVTIAANGTILLTPLTGEKFTDDSGSNIVVVSSAHTAVTVSSANVAANNTLLTINTTNSGNSGAAVYYTAQVTPTNPKVKQRKDIFVKTTYLDGVTAYGLGVPDGFKLLSVSDNANAAANTAVDYTSSFTLRPGQNAMYYGHSYLTLNSRGPRPANNTVLWVNFSCFQVDFDTGYNFFTIDSYGDDVDMQDVPVYVYDRDGHAYNMRNCIDFRPYRANTAAYANSAASANLIAANSYGLPSYTTQMFSNTLAYVTPAAGTYGTVDYQKFMPRKDLLCVDSHGDFSVVKGTAAVFPVAPVLVNKTALAEIAVPGLPLLTPAEAAKVRDPSFSVRVTPLGVKNYTMKEIDAISKQVDRLSYYVAMSALETSAQSLVIQDADGLNKFKNGIVVDSFESLKLSNTFDPEFAASVDFGESSLNPEVDQFHIDLVPVSSNNISFFGENNNVATLSFNTQNRVIAQPYGTNVRSASQGAFRYWGKTKISPQQATFYDVVTKPTLASGDLFSSTAAFAGTQYDQKSSPLTSADKSKNTKTTVANTTDKPTNADYVNQIQANSNGSQAVPIGSGYITNYIMRPYMRSTTVRIVSYGLRPNTRHYFFFGSTSIDSWVRPCKKVSGKWSPYGAFGSSVKTDANGVLAADFNIPEQKFPSGGRIIRFYDVAGWTNRGTASSYGRARYDSYSFALTQVVPGSRKTPSTRHTEVDFVEVDTNNATVARQVPVTDSQDAGIAQTFFVKRAMVGTAECLFASKINLYFQRKSPTNGVTLSVREVFNGYPTSEIIPFSSVHLDSSDVSVSADGSVATVFQFEAPVRLDAEKEYALVVQADAEDPDYLLWTARVGYTDAHSGKRVVQDWGDGSLFTSTNGRAWTPLQTEDIKFDFYRYNFGASSGSVKLRSDRYEFLKLSGGARGSFTHGEEVYSITGSSKTVSVSANSFTMTSGVSLSSYGVGDWVLVTSGADKSLLRVIAVNSSTSVEVHELPSFTSASATAKLVVAGSVSKFDPTEVDYLVLGQSSAKTGNVFEVGDTLVGFSSGATATVLTIDDVALSYVQPMIESTTDITTLVRVFGEIPDPALPNNTPYSTAMVFGDNCWFQQKGFLLKSVSNDPTRANSERIVLSLSRSGSQTSSPFVDLENAVLYAYRYKLSSSADSTSKYISQPVTLADGFEADDFKIWLDAYKPTGSDIRVYLRPRNSADPTPLRQNSWIQLQLESGAGLYSSLANRDDLHEYVYSVPAASKTANVLTYTNNVSTFSGIKQFDLKIELLSPVVHRSPRVLDYRGIAFE